MARKHRNSSSEDEEGRSRAENEIEHKRSRREDSGRKHDEGRERRRHRDDDGEDDRSGRKDKEKDRGRGRDSESDRRNRDRRRELDEDEEEAEEGEYRVREDYDREDGRKDRRRDRERERDRRSDENGDRDKERERDKRSNENGDRDKGRERDRRSNENGDRHRRRSEKNTRGEVAGVDLKTKGDDKENDVPKVRNSDGNVGVDLVANMGRSGGVYIPPFKLARMMKEIEDKSSLEYQRMTWDALRKSINGLVNKVNSTNIKNIIPELFAENLIRGRGLFCRSCMKSQMASPGFTAVFAALVAVVNTKFPEVGDLLLRRIILQLQRAYKRNDKPQLLAAVKFIAHLVNQQVVHELIALELLTLLLEKPSDDSVEVAVGFVTECGSALHDVSPWGSSSLLLYLCTALILIKKLCL